MPRLLQRREFSTKKSRAARRVNLTTPRILLCERTDFLLFLKAFADGTVYYDPAIKIENASGPSPAVKRRSQFRTKHTSLTKVYYHSEVVEVAI